MKGAILRVGSLSIYNNEVMKKKYIKFYNSLVE